MLKVITVASDPIRTQKLVDSLEKFGHDYHVIYTEWKGFGTKILAVRDYILKHPEIQRFIFCDAYDVVCLAMGGTLPLDSIVFSAEKNCWPVPDLSIDYPETTTPYKYLNSGLYYAPRDEFLALFDWETPEYTTDDQLWATRQFLYNPNSNIKIDSYCINFQSYSFIEEGEFSYENNRLLNNKTNNKPFWAHGNGTTDMTLIYELVK